MTNPAASGGGVHIAMVAVSELIVAKAPAADIEAAVGRMDAEIKKYGDGPR